MSTLLSLNGGDPLLHMTSDTKTKAQLETGILSTSIFHSDLPYIFIRDRFELTSYTNWAGGRKFALSSALTTFRAANPDLAYLLLLEDSSGNKWIHEPMVNVKGMWVYSTASGTAAYNEVVGALNGNDYQVAYTASDTELASLTQNTIRTSISLTFRTYDASDTSVTVFRTDNSRNCKTHSMWAYPSCSYPYDGDYNVSNSVFYQMTSCSTFGGTNLQSTSNNVVKVTFIFLNVTHSSTTFDRQTSFSYSNINIDPTNFTVNSLNLASFSPLISHGPVTSGTTVVP